MNATQLLRLWELQHGPMEATAREIFLDSPEISIITSFDATTIVRMIRTSQDLRELASALETEPRAGRKRTPGILNQNLYSTGKSARKNAYAKPSAQYRYRRRRRPDGSEQETSVLRRPRPSSIGKAPAEQDYTRLPSPKIDTGPSTPKPNRDEQEKLRDIAKKFKWWEDS